MLGALFGLAFFGILLAWVMQAGMHAWVVLTVTEAIFVATFAWAAGRVLERGPILGAIASSALWVLIMEASRSRVPLGGFPWGSIGDPLVGTPLGLVAPIAGGIGVAWLTMYLSALAAAAVRRQVGAAAWGLVPAVGIVVLSLPFGPSAHGCGDARRGHRAGERAAPAGARITGADRPGAARPRGADPNDPARVR